MVKIIFYDVTQMVMMFALEGLFTVFAVVWYENWILEGRLKTLFVLYILLVFAMRQSFFAKLLIAFCILRSRGVMFKKLPYAEVLKR